MCRPQGKTQFLATARHSTQDRTATMAEQALELVKLLPCKALYSTDALKNTFASLSYCNQPALMLDSDDDSSGKTEWIQLRLLGLVQLRICT
jgi:hypothetical protein